MAEGISNVPSGVLRSVPPGITETSTVNEVLDAAADNFIYLWGGWQKPAFAPLTDQSHQWNFILLRCNPTPLNYTHFFAICSDNVNNNAHSGIYLYNYSGSKWIKLSHTII